MKKHDARAGDIKYHTLCWIEHIDCHVKDFDEVANAGKAFDTEIEAIPIPTHISADFDSKNKLNA